MPAPAAIRPSASEAALMRLTVGSSQSGMRKPSRLATRPEAVAMIKGLRSSSRAKPCCPWRAMGHTAATLNSGTHTPISTAIISRPLRAGQALGQRQADEGVEAKRHLRAGRVVAPRRGAAQPGQCGRL
jgi:hypothetical protein